MSFLFPWNTKQEFLRISWLFLFLTIMVLFCVIFEFSQIKSSHHYLYSAIYNADHVKAALQLKFSLHSLLFYFTKSSLEG